jgi:hypothetical protein
MIASNRITMTPTTTATPVIKSWMMSMVQSWRAELSKTSAQAGLLLSNRQPRRFPHHRRLVRMAR